jgi:SAM-dependent methyltransferase
MPMENHDIGIETLRRMSVLKRYNDWIMEKIEPWMGNHVLEVGAGIGNVSRYFLNRKSLILTDVHEEYLEALLNEFSSLPNVTVERYNLDESGEHLRNRTLDTILVLNVLEHIRDDVHALRDMASLLVPGGRIILQLPAHRLLFGSLDRNLDHFRRYSRREITLKLKESGFVPEHISTFNMFGALGWFTCSRILQKKILPQSQLGLFNRLTPLFMAIERKFPPPFGLSILAVGRKPL